MFWLKEKPVTFFFVKRTGLTFFKKSRGQLGDWEVDQCLILQVLYRPSEEPQVRGATAGSTISQGREFSGQIYALLKMVAHCVESRSDAVRPGANIKFLVSVGLSIPLWLPLFNKI